MLLHISEDFHTGKGQDESYKIDKLSCLVSVAIINTKHTILTEPYKNSYQSNEPPIIDRLITNEKVIFVTSSTEFD